MSSSSPTFSKLSSTNYNTWSGDMEAWLKAQGLWRIVNGSQARPSFKSKPASPGSPQELSSLQQELREAFEAKCFELQDTFDARSNKAAGWIWLMLEQD